MENFNCKSCGGMCCVTPPYLMSVEEIEKYLKMGADIYAVELRTKNKKEYLIILEKDYKKDTCYFFDIEKKECSIYDDRPEVCKQMVCNFLDKEPLEVLEMIKNGTIVTNTIGLKEKRFLEEELDEITKKHSTEIVDAEGMIKKLMTKLEVYNKLEHHTVIKIFMEVIK